MYRTTTIAEWNWRRLARSGLVLAGLVVSLALVPWVHNWPVDAAALPEDEAYRTFNMGLGMMIVLDAKSAPEAAAVLRSAGEKVFEVGEIVAGEGKVTYR